MRDSRTLLEACGQTSAWITRGHCGKIRHPAIEFLGHAESRAQLKVHGVGPADSLPPHGPLLQLRPRSVLSQRKAILIT